MILNKWCLFSLDNTETLVFNKIKIHVTVVEGNNRNNGIMTHLSLIA